MGEDGLNIIISTNSSFQPLPPACPRETGKALMRCSATGTWERLLEQDLLVLSPSSEVFKTRLDKTLSFIPL